jgi:hypothetical protein
MPEIHRVNLPSTERFYVLIARVRLGRLDDLPATVTPYRRVAEHLHGRFTYYARTNLTSEISMETISISMVGLRSGPRV